MLLIREHQTKARPQILVVILDSCDVIVSCSSFELCVISGGGKRKPDLNFVAPYF